MLRHCYELEVSQVLPLAARSTGGLRILLLLPRPTIPRLLSYCRGCARSRPRPGRRDLQKEGTLRELAQGSAFGASGTIFRAPGCSATALVFLGLEGFGRLIGRDPDPELPFHIRV